ncbi:inositol polyphosphate multikinase-like [Saccoglossus kowalevskii]|uniref:Kinase n=1 Tax=Saccoglossus kowalevskii TaxID=10224 RepID=A0ABM0GU11_SACKO|nr:PREDICTED: inositol polyphosphate multikinase-like [Saccoglossus kowalevskii]
MYGKMNMADMGSYEAEGVVRNPPRSHTPPLPEGCEPLTNQVAGHTHGKGKAGLLQSADGTILKPISSRPSGKRELGFYQEVFRDDQSDPVLTGLRRFIPQYHGVLTIEQHYFISYMKLDDITKCFRKPCIMDIKIGRRSCVRGAPQTKVESSTRKHPQLDKVGFQITGMRIYHPSKDQFVLYDRSFGRELEGHLVMTGLTRYFSNRKMFRRDVIPAFIRRLEKIENWFNCQEKYHFISSSLLFVYEGDIANDEHGNNNDVITNGVNDDVIRDVIKDTSSSNNSSNNTCIRDNDDMPSAEKGTGEPEESDHVVSIEPNRSLMPEDALTDIRMIDFPHAVPSTTADDDYLYGLRKLLTCLRTLLIEGPDQHQRMYLD